MTATPLDFTNGEMEMHINFNTGIVTGIASAGAGSFTPGETLGDFANGRLQSDGSITGLTLTERPNRQNGIQIGTYDSINARLYGPNGAEVAGIGRAVSPSGGILGFSAVRQ